MFTEEHQQDYDEKGYFVVDDAIDSQMLEDLRAAARRIKAKVRAGEVDVYSDFNGAGEPFHIVGLISPEFDEPIFGEYLALPSMLEYVKSQLGNELRMSSMAIFTNPHDEPFHMGWHRDVGREPRDLPEDAELEFLRRPRSECRWELALVDSDCLAPVPGSQNRYRTEREWNLMSKGKNESLAGEEVIHLSAGQTIFWNGKIIHRSLTQPARERLTIVGAWDIYSEGPKVEVGPFAWMLDDEVRAGLPQSIHFYYDRWKAQYL